MLTQEQIDKPLTTLNGGDALIALQLISRLVQIGGIKETELATVGVFRNRLVVALNETTGVNYDEAVAAAAAEQAAQTSQRAQVPAPTPIPAGEQDK